MGGAGHKGGEVPGRKYCGLRWVVSRGFLEGLGLGLCAQGQVGLVGGEGSHAILSGQAGTSLLVPYRFGGLLDGGKVKSGGSQHPYC